MFLACNDNNISVLWNETGENDPSIMEIPINPASTYITPKAPGIGNSRPQISIKRSFHKTASSDRATGIIEKDHPNSTTVRDYEATTP